jgi:recombination protein RecR
MLDYPNPIRALIEELRRLPSVGPRTAERLALHLLQDDTSHARALAHALVHAADAIRPCPRCGFFTEEDLCAICRDPTRDATLLCVVHHAADILTLEKSNSFKGRYHVLGGLLSPLDGVGPEDLRLDSLWLRAEEEKPAELILALGADVKAETTALYLAAECKSRGLRASRLATGIAVGGSLEFSDPLTLSHALQDRKPI